MQNTIDVEAFKSLVLADIGIEEANVIHSRSGISPLFDDIKVRLEFLVRLPDGVDSSDIHLGDRMGGFHIMSFKLSLIQGIDNALKYEIEALITSRWVDGLIRDIYGSKG